MQMSNEELVAAIQAGEDRMGELWIQVEGLVKWTAKHRIAILEGRGGVEFEDLYQSGYPALVAAVYSYKPDKGAFSTWFMFYLRTAFAEATGHRTAKQKLDPLNAALSLDTPLGDDADSNTYLYSEYGAPHIDLENDKKQLAFTNIVLQCAEVVQLDANGYMEFKVYQQSGKGYYITGGAAIPVTWEKGVDYEPTKFYDMSGNEIILNTGKTYVGFVSTDRWDELVLK